jgi:hypothetical protein
MSCARKQIAALTRNSNACCRAIETAKATQAQHAEQPNNSDLPPPFFVRLLRD